MTLCGSLFCGIIDGKRSYILISGGYPHEQQVSKGIALILFGILLCAGSEEINATILFSFGDFPFSAIGVIVGAVGLYMVFSDKAE